LRLSNTSPAAPAPVPAPAPAPQPAPAAAASAPAVHVPPVYATQSAAPAPAGVSTTQPGPTASAPTAHETGTHVEAIVFQGHPNILIYIGSLSLAALVTVLGLIGLVYFRGDHGFMNAAMWYLSLAGMLGGLITFGVRYLQIEFIKYRLSNQRLFITTGILSRKTVETELFRVRDISVHQSLIERMIGIGTIHALTTDKDIPEMYFRGINEPLKIKEVLRQHVMEARQRTRTRDLDVADVDSTNNLV
jgi:membrane protein YdbS with pleckstrin-like domain